MKYKAVIRGALWLILTLWIGLLSLTVKAQPVTDRVIVELNTPFDVQGFASTASAQQASIQMAQQNLISSLVGYDVQVNAAYKYIPYMALSVDDAVLEQLLQSGLVRGIYPDLTLQFDLAESGPHIGAPTAHTAGYDGTGQTIVIIDTGVDIDHPFFSGRIVSEACFSSAGAGMFSLCPNGQDEQFGPGAGDACALSGCFHGTHVAGIAAGSGSTFDGIAPAANLIAIQIAHRESCSSGQCAVPGISDILKALEYVYTLRNTYTIAAVNMSLGSPVGFASQCDSAQPFFRDIFAQLRSVGIAPIVGTGNSGFDDAISLPSCISNAISVGATLDNADTVASYSNSMSGIDLLAPGSNITSSMPGGTFASQNGTSMATPHVSGAWAVMRDAMPSASIEQILAALQNTGPLVLDSGNGVRAPRIQVDAAANALVAGTQPTVGSVYINEVRMLTNQAVELYNFGTTPVNMTGWHLIAYGASGTLERDYTLPNFTLNAGAYVTLLRGTGANTATTLYIGDFATTWASGGAALLRSGNVGIDFVRWGSSTLIPSLATGFTGATPALPTTGRTLGRDFLFIDSDDSGDWSAQNPSLGTQNLVERPANDEFASATVINTLPLNVVISTNNATTQTGETVPDCAPDMGRTVWYRYTPTASGQVEFSTTGSNFDTSMAIYIGSFASLVQIACNDDIVPGQNPQSRIRMNLVSGTTYYVQAGGYNNAGGSLHFNASENITNGNDDISGAVTVGALPFTYLQDTTDATGDPGDPTPSCNTDPVQQSVWFKLTPAVSETLRFETKDSDFDTVMTIFTGTPGNLTQAACHDDINGLTDFTSRIDLPVQVGTPLYIMISGGAAGYSGNLKLNVRSLVLPPVPNNEINSAVSVGALPFTYLQDTSAATSNVSDPVPTCNTDPVQQSVWFILNPTASETLRFETKDSAFDTVMTIFTGAPGNLTEIACHDDISLLSLKFTSLIDLPVQVGTPLYIMISGGAAGYSGNLKLNVRSLYEPPTLTTPANGAVVQTTQPTLSWTGAPSAAGYFMQLGTTNPPTTTPTFVNTGTSYTPIFALAPTTYYWRVQTYAGDGLLSVYSPVRSFTVPTQSTENVPRLNMYFTAQPTLTWNHVTWAASYVVQVDIDKSFKPSFIHEQTVPANIQSLMLPPLTDGIYYWRICALAMGQTTCRRWSKPEQLTVDAPG